MNNSFEKVKHYLTELNVDIQKENPEQGILIISDPNQGINNMVIGCMDPILIMEQHIFDIKNDDCEIALALLKKNRDIVHGAFALDESGKKVIFRDTLQLENLDLNELEGSLNSLSLLLSEYSSTIIKFSKL
ncbi:MAG: molecular chaperone Tir [Flavobacteriales bacterium]|nr:molecular chaperone Tir [Flavobacteriales bacterium]